MPLVKAQVEQSEQEASTEDVAAILFKDDGTLTLEGEIIADFLEDVDLDDVFDDPEVRKAGLVRASKVWAKFDEEAEEWEEVEKGTEGAEELPFESIDPEDMAELIDLDDLQAMFEYYVENEMPSETLEDKARLAAARQIVGLDEWKKKGFKAAYAAAGEGPAKTAMHSKLNRMLGAMIFKKAIKKANKPGTGYDAGDYKKSAGWSQGTKAGLKAYNKATGRMAGKIKAAKRKEKAAAKVTAKQAAKGKRFKKKAATKKGAAAKLSSKKAKKGKAISASATGAVGTLSEGAALSGKMLDKMHQSSLVEAEKK